MKCTDINNKHNNFPSPKIYIKLWNPIYQKALIAGIVYKWEEGPGAELEVYKWRRGSELEVYKYGEGAELQVYKWQNTMLNWKFINGRS